jgi:tRNA threonylcarbamoyl adenosine modification protein (Sua5/YciO/YrdC/YwlC family)
LIVEHLKEGAVVAYPTDSGYALGCCMGLKAPLERIKKIRNLDDKHNFTLICRDLSEISTYGKVDNPTFRLLKRCTPGGYTFILAASHEVPRLLQSRRKTIGIRIPDHNVPLKITECLGQPLLSTTLILPGQQEPLKYPEDVNEQIGREVDIIIDAGYCGFEPTSVIDCSEGGAVILRRGSGDVSFLEQH